MLHSDLLFPLILFVIVASFTPGPNNIMLMNVGLNYSFRRAVPAMLGVAFGFAFLIFCVGLGLGALFTAYPVLHVVMKYGAALYLLYLAWKIAKSAPPKIDDKARRKPMTFLQAAAFQWINPKGWVMAVSSITTYAAVADYPNNIAVIVGVSWLLSFGSTATWVGMGSVMQRFLHKPHIVRAFNIIMALLLVASLYPVLTE